MIGSRAAHMALVGLVLLALALPATTWAGKAASAESGNSGTTSTRAEELRGQIEAQRKAERKARSELNKLSSREREMFKDLAGLEDRILSAEEKIWRQEAELAAIEERQREALRAHKAASDALAEARTRLDALLARLWPLHTAQTTSRLSALSDWTESDRRFTWLAQVYRETQEAVREVAEQTRLQQETLAEQQRLGEQAQAELDALRNSQERLLADKLELARSIREVRAERLTREQALSGVLEAIEGLNIRLKMLSSRKIEQFKGQLPWPAQGKVVARYAPSADPPVRGVGLAVSAGETVRAVSWGQVVHNDLLRGFGRVIILSHGDDYYTLYAYLAESFVRDGQEVERGEPLGTAGFYPEADGPGVYFELRFHQKAINPVGWLTAK